MKLAVRPSPKFGQSHYYKAVIGSCGNRWVHVRCAESEENYEAWTFMVCTVPSYIITDDYFAYAVFRCEGKTIRRFDKLPKDIQTDLLNRLKSCSALEDS
jgi:hypothetical protein